MKQRPGDLEPEEIEFCNEAGFARESELSCPDPDLLMAAQSDSLPEQERRAVTRHLDSCDRCRNLAEDFSTAEQLSLTRDEEERIWRRVSTVGDKEKARPFSMWAWMLRPLPLAAALAVVFGTVLFYTSSRNPSQPETSSPQLAEEKPELPVAPPESLRVTKPPILLPATAVLVFRGSEAPTEDPSLELGQAMRPFREDNYEEAAELLGRVAKKFPQSSEAHFYRGVSLLLLDRDAEAREPLRQAKQLASGTLARHAQWYLALISFRAGDLAAARTELQYLCETEGERQSDSCRAIQELQGR